MRKYTKREVMILIEGKLNRHFGIKPGEAGCDQMFKAVAMVIRDVLTEQLIATESDIEKLDKRQIHYMSMEFLIGRSLLNNAFNLGIHSQLSQVLEEMGFSFADLMETEPDAALGNGGLGRLAACYFDALTTLQLPATGYSIRYNYGVFKQKIIDGQQVELPDEWLDKGEVWMIPRMDEVQEVRFGGSIERRWENGRLVIDHTGYMPVLAVPYDMPISGYNSDTSCGLRLWESKAKQGLDMGLFSRGEYLKSIEQQAMAEVISKVLYPEDNHFEGRTLRLKQQYFFVSATVQSIVRKHKQLYERLDNFHELHVLHINDTHPAMAIPELMRILMDEEGYSWDAAWEITSKSFAYTNHTILSEALERWPKNVFEATAPRILDIITEINERFCRMLWEFFPGETETISNMAIIAYDEVRMANLCICAAFSVNGVSELHSRILKETVFASFAKVYPDKFRNVTNGIAHRRWLCQVNPRLGALLSELIGPGFITDADELRHLAAYKDDTGVLDRLAVIKRGNKERLAALILKENGVAVPPDAMFDIQTKRLHEYKRQLLNIMNILHRYDMILKNPDIDMAPKVYVFSAKAAPGYYMAKQIIKLIISVAHEINNNPAVRDRIKVVFLENYRVSAAEIIIPAADLSEQISTAGKEASGTGNMKFMINGAVTIGTMDGANVEIYEAVGDDSMFLFGLRAHEVEHLLSTNSYNPMKFYRESEAIGTVLEMMLGGFSDGRSYQDIVTPLLVSDWGADPYMLLADFDSYISAHDRASAAYRDKYVWNRMALLNIAHSGRFSADRSIRDYANDIWDVAVD